MILKLINYLKHLWKCISRIVFDVLDFQKIKCKFQNSVMQISGLDLPKCSFLLYFISLEEDKTDVYESS